MTSIEKLKNASAAFRLNGIMECINAGEASEEEINVIKDLRSDRVVLAGRPLYVYAYSALDLLRVESYQGDDPDVKDFIKALKK